MRHFSLFLLLLVSTCVRAQSFTYSGTVAAEDGELLPFATIIVKDSATGTTSDLDGRFSFFHTDSVTVVTVAYTGFESKDMKVKAGDELRLILPNSGAVLEEVVVVGYGAARKSDLTGSVTKISRESSKIRSSRSEVTSSAMMDESSAGSPSPARPASAPSSGQLTAGETNDFSKWDLWEDISQEDLAEFRDIWRFYPNHRYAVQLTHPNGLAAVDVPVELIGQDGGVIWSARTDNHGRAELWDGMNVEKEIDSSLRIVATSNGKPVELGAAIPIAQGMNKLQLTQDCDQLTAVDIAFVVDATGSMGDEIEYLSSEMTDVLLRTKEQLTNAELRTAAVFYRDSTDDYVTIHQDFAERIDTTVSYVNRQYASGGGDHPEAVDEALETAVDQLTWRENAAARLLFLVLDAPPHQDATSKQRLAEVTRKAAAKGIRIIPVVCSGMSKDGEYLLRSIALATNGTYVFLTDDSGIGGKHLAPTTDAYDVEKLNDLLVRVITAFSQTTDCAEVGTVEAPQQAEKKKGQLKFKAFPNPTTGPLTLKLPKGEGDVFVYDLNGKLLRRLEVTGRKQTLNLEGLAAGTYALRYLLDDAQGSRLIVLTR